MKKFIRIIITSVLILVLLLSTVSSYALEIDEHNVMLTSSSVREMRFGDIVYYECTDGTCFGYMPENGICWVQCDGAWYGLENYEGMFASGSTFWLKRLSSSDGGEYDALYNNIDDTTLELFKWKPDILAFGVQDADGAEYTRLDGPATFYIQCGSAWNTEDFEARYIASGGDETLGHVFKQVNDPVNGVCALITLNHLGSCLVFNTDSAVGSIFSNSPCVFIVIAGVVVIAAAIIITVRKKKLAKQKTGASPFF